MRRNTDKFKPTVSTRPASYRECEYPGCHLPAEHRAPKSRDRLEDYLWYCLEHVREYNKSWNFCAGMDIDEIESEIRQDTVWRRPTWPIGSRPNETRWRFIRDGKVADDFGAFYGAVGGQEETGGARRPKTFSAEDKAFKILGLDPSASLSEVKMRYKELVKVHHPDRNGGDKLAEERLKDINDAYATLRKCVNA